MHTLKNTKKLYPKEFSKVSLKYSLTRVSSMEEFVEVSTSLNTCKPIDALDIVVATGVFRPVTSELKKAGIKLALKVGDRGQITLSAILKAGFDTRPLATNKNVLKLSGVMAGSQLMPYAHDRIIHVANLMQILAKTYKTDFFEKEVF